MRFTGWRYLAVISALAAIEPAAAATRPRYGGVLLVEMRERVASIEGSRVAGLIFEHLVRIDDDGRPQPGLAVGWQSDAEQKRWEFRLRSGVKFHDGIR